MDKQKWAHENLMKLNKSKWKVLCLDYGNPRHKYRLEEGLIQNRRAKKDLGILMDEKLYMSQHHVLTA